MGCEMCGRNTEDLVTIKIEGAILRVCKSCAKHGVRVKEQRKQVVEDEIVPVEGYGNIIRREREKMGLTQEELARRLNISASHLRNLESEKVELDLKTGRILEKFFNIRLFEKVKAEEPVKSKNDESTGLTLEDVAKVKWGR